MYFSSPVPFVWLTVCCCRQLSHTHTHSVVQCAVFRICNCHLISTEEHRGEGWYSRAHSQDSSHTGGEGGNRIGTSLPPLPPLPSHPITSVHLMHTYPNTPHCVPNAARSIDSGTSLIRTLLGQKEFVSLLVRCPDFSGVTMGFWDSEILCPIY